MSATGIFTGVVFFTIFAVQAEPPPPNFYNSVQKQNFGPPEQYYRMPPVPESYKVPVQLQNYVVPSHRQYLGILQEEGSYEQSINLGGPTVTCSNGRLMSTPAGMAIILPCMEQYRDNITCVEYCYAARAMDALCEDGEINFDNYISFIPKNFPQSVVTKITEQWSRCIRQYGRRIDKYDKTCTGLNEYISTVRLSKIISGTRTTKMANDPTT